MGKFEQIGTRFVRTIPGLGASLVRDNFRLENDENRSTAEYNTRT